MTPKTIGFSEAKARLSEITEEVNRTGRSVLVYKRNKPWVNITPASEDAQQAPRLSMFGALNAYANPAIRKQEDGAWEEAMVNKNAVR
ncbi:MAG: type II toxin-antitoxin system Phd/YefM family antitoxin [Coriobacteriales bacterium]|jgi:prevent-host-death family protein|nr:type II toxin-antitoxin system Phd/YefM family antitoxin [Coriobacteriales bacterium]